MDEQREEGQQGGRWEVVQGRPASVRTFEKKKKLFSAVVLIVWAVIKAMLGGAGGRGVEVRIHNIQAYRLVSLQAPSLRLLHTSSFIGLL